MGILRRFKDIMSSNINALLDKAEDPEKMIDQYMRNASSDLGKVKAETASIMAEEQRAKRALNECQTDIEKMQKYALKALEAENEGDARIFLEKKATLTAKQTELQQAYDLAAANTDQMRKMHDKLVEDISKLEARRSMIKGKAAVAKTKERMNKMASSVNSASYSLSSFDKMEEKVNRALDEANAMEELNKGPEDNIDNLTAKYESSVDVDDELAALREQLKQNQA
ncbi:PspA/IM30 family protein [Virgibacillus halophilus]|uniref:PspA/IM30 family protein n=1 Tax=Tigheibacillus halophilus TaxID=361280 RepID=A0ABU5C9M9_9BACI|nr:PspA/IM30 family protein [Virgibacillus halophilus]